MILTAFINLYRDMNPGLLARYFLTKMSARFQLARCVLQIIHIHIIDLWQNQFLVIFVILNCCFGTLLQFLKGKQCHFKTLIERLKEWQQSCVVSWNKQGSDYNYMLLQLRTGLILRTIISLSNFFGYFCAFWSTYWKVLSILWLSIFWISNCVKWILEKCDWLLSVMQSSRLL